jgi:crotonobetainyl-CoA:carnitine CoA-transferase CaiB-like acyl-CoA transferase
MPISHGSAPPLLGQHTQDILSTLGGLSDDEIKALGEQGII